MIRTRTVRALGPVLLATLLAVGLGACTRATWNAPGETPDPPKVTLTAPADGATDVSTATEIEFSLAGTRTSQVTLTEEGGATVDGAMREDGSSWVPGQQLKYGTRYTATVTATKSDGSSATASTTFTTMEQPGRLVRVQSFNGDDVVYGIGMPIIIRFEIDVPESARAAIQRRLFVTSEPAQEGVWHWISSRYHNAGSEVHYRPKDYWQPGTKIHARIATGGMSWGFADVVGRNDLTLDFTIGQARVLTVDNATKHMTVTEDGQVVKDIPVSLGKPSTPSSSGTMLVMSRNPTYHFDTRRESGVAGGGYVVDVAWAEQLTTSGEFIHAAPWSVAQQGHTNVSHGCVNVSETNAKWIFDTVQVGDPVIIKGTEHKLTWGDGFTDWDIPWEEYVKGSAIPYLPATPSPSPTA
jgi:lipoprotein-anchoring transpeptidase ErfK/SrfK